MRGARRPGVTAVVAAAAWQHGPGSARRPPTAHAGNAPCARTRPLPRRLPDGHDDRCLSARYGAGCQNGTDRSVGSRRAESAPLAFRLRRASACSDGGQRPKPGPLLHLCGTVCCLRSSCLSRCSLGRAAGDAVPALAGRGRLERGTRCARSVHGRGKTGGAIPRGEFAPSDPRCADNPRRIGRNASVVEAHPLLAARASAATV